MMNLAALLVTEPMRTHITGIDWLVIALYFGLLMGVAWYVVRKNKDNTTDYFLAGRNLGWWVIGSSIFASNIGSEHVVGLAGAGATSGVALAHYELHAWCLLILAWVFVPFYMRSQVFTMPEFLEKRFSAGSRYVLSIVSIVTFIVSKIAVGIFAGGVVFGTLLPEMHMTIGGIYIDSFWIGSVLVIVLTGLYTTLGGMRAVAYNDAVQAIILIIGSACLTFYGLHKLGGWHELKVIAGSDMFNLWKPLIPAGVQGTWAPVLETNAAGQVVKQAWYFNGNFPWLGMLFCAPIVGLWYWCTDQYIVQRALGAPNQTEARRGSIFAAFLKLFPVYPVHHPGHHLLRLGQERQDSRVDCHHRSGRPRECRRRPGVFSHDGAVPVATRATRYCRGRIAISVDGIAGRRVQRLLHVIHGRSLREMEAPGYPGPTGASRPHCDWRDGTGGLAMDSGHQERPRALRLFAGGAGVPGAADLRGVLSRRLL